MMFPTVCNLRSGHYTMLVSYVISFRVIIYVKKNLPQVQKKKKKMAVNTLRLSRDRSVVQRWATG
jgi:hypothetical protein